MKNINKFLNGITSINKYYENKAKEHLDFLAKPIGSLGELEEIAKKLCSIFETTNISLEKKAIIILSSDNGIFEEGVASTPQNVTAIQTINILEGKTGVGVLSKHFNIDLIVADLGIREDIYHKNLISKKIRRSTKNFLKESAMTESEVLKAINIGIELANNAIKDGYKIIGVGEMGIGNTSTSSAVLASLLNIKGDNIYKVVGKGAGLTDEAYKHKIDVIRKAINFHKIDNSNVFDIIQKVGGFDIAGMIGVYISCAYNKIPIVIDGFISIVALLCAIKLNPLIKEYVFLSHYSMEKGYSLALEELQLVPYFNLKMRLGEGSGCPIMFSLIDAAIAIFKNMATFDEAKIDTEYLKNTGFN